MRRLRVFAFLILFLPSSAQSEPTTVSTCGDTIDGRIDSAERALGDPRPDAVREALRCLISAMRSDNQRFEDLRDGKLPFRAPIEAPLFIDSSASPATDGRPTR